MAVGPAKHERIVPYALDARERLIRKIQVASRWSMALAAGARTPAAQVVERELGRVPVSPIDGQDSSAAQMADFDGFMRCHDAVLWAAGPTTYSQPMRRARTTAPRAMAAPRNSRVRAAAPIISQKAGPRFGAAAAGDGATTA